jgi:hypothetical protein
MLLTPAALVEVAQPQRLIVLQQAALGALGILNAGVTGLATAQQLLIMKVQALFMPAQASP